MHWGVGDFYPGLGGVELVLGFGQGEIRNFFGVIF